MSYFMTKDTKIDWRGGPRTGRKGQRSADRTDYSAIAAVEYRRALRTVLAARSEVRVRMF